MKKSTKHMQFVRISLLIFALGFFFACSLGTQRYGKLSLSIEVPDYLKTETNEQPSNARFIHPDGEKLEFQLFVRDELFFEQTIPLNPESQSPQKVSISVDKVPYNVPLFAKITVFGEKTPTQGDEALLGSNDIYIGYLKSGNNKLTLGVKPVSDANVAYQKQEKQGQEFIYLESADTSAGTFNIEMFPKKGLYTISGYDSANIYLYDSDGKKYQNSLFIGGEEGLKTCVFYHPEDKASTYYAYLSSQTINLYGEKLDQDILITRYDDNMDSDVIVISEENIDFGYLSPWSGNSSTEIFFTIYNPYPFTLNLKYKIENADEVSNPAPSPADSKDKFKFTDFPKVLLPGKSEKFTVNFHPDNSGTYTTYSVKSTISAPGLKDFVLHFTGTGSGT